MARFNLRFLVCTLSLLLLAPIAGCDIKSAMQQFGANQVKSSSKDEVRKMFEQANAACPQKTDAFTTLNEGVIIDDNTIEFRYSVDKCGERMLAAVDQQTLKKNAVEVMKGNPMAVAVADRDLTIHHLYESKTGVQVLAYEINKETLAGNFNPVGKEKSNPFLD